MIAMDKTQASFFLVQKCTQISTQLGALASKSNFAGILQAVINHFHSLIEKAEIPTMVNYLRTISRVYRKGDQETRFLVENMFLRAQQGIKNRCTGDQWQYYYGHMPLDLRTAHRLINNNTLY